MSLDDLLERELNQTLKWLGWSANQALDSLSKQDKECLDHAGAEGTLILEHGRYGVYLNGFTLLSWQEINRELLDLYKRLRSALIASPALRAELLAEPAVLDGDKPQDTGCCCEWRHQLDTTVTSPAIRPGLFEATGICRVSPWHWVILCKACRARVSESRQLYQTLVRSGLGDLTSIDPRRIV